jgi:hypothetical protein
MPNALEPTETASVYVNTEIARLLLCDDRAGDLDETRSAIAEAAYYLSDLIEPEERARLLTTAEEIEEQRRDAAKEDRAGEALGLLSETADDVEALLRGPGASSEIRIARKAVSRAIAGLTRHFGLPSSHLGAECQPGTLGALRRGRHARREERPRAQ